MLGGESSDGGSCPVDIVIPGGGEGDQSAGSPGVKGRVGWAKTGLLRQEGK
jgi:hypothetical protein